MELLHLFPLPLTFIILILTLILIKSFTRKSPKSPPSPWKLPFIGHMHHLFGSHPHRALHKLSQKHGPIMHLKLGHVDHIIISSPEAAREILKTHDIHFASRPELIGSTIVFYNNEDIAFAPYSTYWRHVRKICVIELLNTRKVKSSASIRESETSTLLSSISMSGGNTPVNITEKLLMLTNTVIARTAFGSECKHGAKFTAELKKGLEAMAGFEISDLFPSLSFLDRMLGTIAKLKNVHSHIDDILDEIVREHQARTPTEGHAEEEEDLVDVLLRINATDDINFPQGTINVKAVIMDMFAAGTETTATSLIWTMAELMKHPKVMEKAQCEIRRVASERGVVQESDLEELHYIKRVIKETLRRHPPVALLVPRVCRKTCNVGGFEIIEGTRVMINVWAIARDPKYWEDADSFIPERFEGSSVDFKGENFQYLPFGGGRRICPGIGFAMATIEITLAKLLFHFDWELPEGKTIENLDMTEVEGLVANKKSDLLFIAKQRFPLLSVS